MPIRERSKSWCQEYHRGFYPIAMDGCKLNLPFYRYGLEVPKIWDISGNNNHGTIVGAVPGYPAEQIANGSFTTAGGGGVDVFASWSEEASGTSTINRDTSDYVSSPASCRLDVDALGSYLFITQAIILLPNKKYRLLFKYKNSSGKVCYWRIVNTGSNIKLDASGQWVVNDDVFISLPNATSWTDFSLEFYGHPSYSPYTVYVSSEYPIAGVNAQLWFDDVSITLLDPLGPGWYFVTDDYVETSSFALSGTVLDLALWVNCCKKTSKRQYFFASGEEGVPAYLAICRASNSDEIRNTFSTGAVSGNVSTNINYFTGYNGQWVHFRGLYDFANAKFYIYRNRVLVETLSPTTPQFPSVNQTKQIGCYANKAVHFLDGMIGDLILCNADKLANHYELTRHIYGV